MEPNVGRTDRIVRIVVGLVLLLGGGATVAGYGPLSVVFAGFLAAVGGVLLLTALTRRCVLNEVFGVDTTRRSTN